MNEQIGNVVLNLDYYLGKDLYSDGEIENKLLEIVKNNNPSEFEEIIEMEKSWPILYHLSSIRGNILNWFPFESNSSILEIGAGCGAITSQLVTQVKNVTAIELSKKRSLINAYRNFNVNNLEIMVGNFEDIYKHINKKFDYITLIGVFEYAESYIGQSNPYTEFLDNINSMLNNKGKIILAIENRLGLKYFAGCREDHIGMFFEGIEGYTKTNGIKTFSKNEITYLLESNRYLNYKFYYPYPDYKLPIAIYSDNYLPKEGELVNNLRNFDSDRFVLFDEAKAFDSIIKSNMFPQFSNSFLILIEKKVG